MATREQEFSEVRRLLNFPKEQQPSPDAIVAALIRQEQFMMNQLNGSGRGWSSNTTSLTSIIDQSEYTLYIGTTREEIKDFGKPLFIYRIADENVIIPVQMADYGSELNNQSYNSVYVPPESGETPGYSGEKLGFFRDGRGVVKARIYPIPNEERTYQIVYATGAIDWTTFEWSDEPAMPEWSHYRCLCVALTLINDCEWKGKTPKENEAYAGRKERSFENQIGLIMPEYNAYLRDPNPGSSIDSVDTWY